MQEAHVIGGICATSVNLVVQNQPCVHHRSDVEKQVVVQITRNSKQAFAVGGGCDVILYENLQCKLGFRLFLEGLQLFRVAEPFRKGEANSGDTPTLGFAYLKQQRLDRCIERGMDVIRTELGVSQCCAFDHPADEIDQHDVGCPKADTDAD